MLIFYTNKCVCKSTAHINHAKLLAKARGTELKIAEVMYNAPLRTEAQEHMAIHGIAELPFVYDTEKNEAYSMFALVAVRS